MTLSRRSRGGGNLGYLGEPSPGSYRIHMDSPFFAELIGVFFLGGVFFSNMFQPFEAKVYLICLFIIHRG